MSTKPKVLIFAPREEPPETISSIENLGCELVFGDLRWQLPRTHHEDTVVEAAREAVALMGTSMRHTPISRRSGCVSSPNTLSASTTSTPRPPPIWASWSATRRPSPTASASPKPL
jgi:hypothetical protein